MKTARERLP